MPRETVFHSAQCARAAADEEKIVIALFDGPNETVGLFTCSDAAALNLAAKILVVLTGDENSWVPNEH